MIEHKLLRYKLRRLFRPTCSIVHSTGEAFPLYAPGGEIELRLDLSHPTSNDTLSGISGGHRSLQAFGWIGSAVTTVGDGGVLGAYVRLGVHPKTLQ
jgi:hypothetical protein